MAATYIPIASTTLATTAASVTFSDIPADYTDLVLRFSAQGNGSQLLKVAVNPSNSNHSYRALFGTGSSAGSGDVGTGSSIIEMGYISTASSTFGSGEIYFPNYIASTNKPISGFVAQEANSTAARITAIAALWSNSSAISTIELGTLVGSGFNSGSTFHLYGISNT